MSTNEQCTLGLRDFILSPYQSINIPNGLIFHMYGLEAGWRHEITVFRERGTDHILLDPLFTENWQLYIYGDPAYILPPWIPVGLKRLLELRKS